MDLNNLLEIPFLSSTVLDSSFGKSAGLRKARQLLCKAVDPGRHFSVGNKGTVKVNTVAALDCVAAARVSKLHDAQGLAAVYNHAGMAKLVQSKRYGTALVSCPINK